MDNNLVRSAPYKCYQAQTGNKRFYGLMMQQLTNSKSVQCVSTCQVCTWVLFLSLFLSHQTFLGTDTGGCNKCCGKFCNAPAEIISPNFGRQHNAPTTQHTYFKLDRQTHTEQISNLSAMTSSNQKIFCSLFEHDTFRTAHTRLNCCRDQSMVLFVKVTFFRRFGTKAQKNNFFD